MKFCEYRPWPYVQGVYLLYTIKYNSYYRQILSAKHLNPATKSEVTSQSLLRLWTLDVFDWTSYLVLCNFASSLTAG
jgi:hypothetical protein